MVTARDSAPLLVHPGTTPEKSMSFSPWGGFARKVLSMAHPAQKAETLFKHACGPIFRCWIEQGQLFMKW
jgi:hypothetical protein